MNKKQEIQQLKTANDLHISNNKKLSQEIIKLKQLNMAYLARIELMEEKEKKKQVGDTIQGELASMTAKMNQFTMKYDENKLDEIYNDNKLFEMTAPK